MEKTMKRTQYTFNASAEWVTTGACTDLKEQFGVLASIKRTGENKCVGTLTVETDSEKQLEQVKKFLTVHPTYKIHFTLVV